VAEGLVSAAVLKRMMNHAVAADVTLGHYVAKSDAQLRAGWQVLADWIKAEAQPCAAQAKAPPGGIAPVAARRAKPPDSAVGAVTSMSGLTTLQGRLDVVLA
jgi:hypothetical protein